VMEPAKRYPPELRPTPAGRKAGRAALEAYYEYTDALIGLLLERYAEGDLVLVLSDHGFEAATFEHVPQVRTLRRMALYAGVTPLPIERVDSTDAMIAHAEKSLLDAKIVHVGEGVVMAAGIPPNEEASTNLMKLHSVGSTTTGTPGR